MRRFCGRGGETVSETPIVHALLHLTACKQLPQTLLSDYCRVASAAVAHRLGTTALWAGLLVLCDWQAAMGFLVVVWSMVGVVCASRGYDTLCGILRAALLPG